jgi:hypothetical protein
MPEETIDRGGNREHRSRSERRWTARGLAFVINGVLAGTGGVFLATASLAATAIAATAAVALGVTIVLGSRP